MATPILLMIYEPREAIQINIVLSLIISAVLFFKIRQDIDLGIAKRFVIASILGLPIGIFLFLMANATRLKLKVVWTSSLGALPVLFIGLYIGQRLFLYINQKYFWWITYVILVFTGIYLLLVSIMN